MSNFSFTSGTNTSGSGVVALVNLIEGQMSAHAAWTKVDTIINGTFTTSVWKNSGTANAIGKDWFFYLSRLTTTPTTFNTSASEGYDSVNKAMIRPLPGSNQATAVPAADFSYGGGTSYLIYSATSTLNVADIWQNTVTPSASAAYSLWTSVTANGVHFWGVVGTTYVGMYYGLFDSFLSSDPFPLIGMNMLSAAGASAANRWTRHPNITAAQANNWFAGGASSNPWTVTTGTLNGAGDLFWNSRPVATRMCVRTATTSVALYGDLRGLLKDAVMFAVGASGAANGDTIVIGADTYAAQYSGINTSAGTVTWIDISVP